jgi:hypothetical protein
MGMKRHSQKISLLLAVVFLFTGIALGFHHHEDEESHEDCQLCLASAHISLIISGDNDPLRLYQDKTYSGIVEKKLSYIQSLKRLSESRAPPKAA